MELDWCMKAVYGGATATAGSKLHGPVSKLEN